MEAARDLFIRGGTDASMEKIAKAAGVGALYRRFGEVYASFRHRTGRDQSVMPWTGCAPTSAPPVRVGSSSCIQPTDRSKPRFRAARPGAG
ncbi:helix-turn-helix domain-containing protein [Streptomyces sp. NPDC047081]|uniref:helix-turn-helix domain-containing protein n=1 Tax=Streptomyces sp. NPDC047081 TaxID=3154706 RepID=UPI0033D78E74